MLGQSSAGELPPPRELPGGNRVKGQMRVETRGKENSLSAHTRREALYILGIPRVSLCN